MPRDCSSIRNRLIRRTLAAGFSASETAAMLGVPVEEVQKHDPDYVDPAKWDLLVKLIESLPEDLTPDPDDAPDLY